MLRQQIELKPRSLVETQRHLDKLCRPLHSLPIAALNRRTVAARLAAIAEANGPAAANRVRGSLGAFFTWSMMEGFRDDNPVSATSKAVENGPRERLLSDAELAIIWRSLNNHQYGAVMKLLILTGLRRGEIGGLCWSRSIWMPILLSYRQREPRTAGRITCQCQHRSGNYSRLSLAATNPMAARVIRCSDLL